MRRAGLLLCVVPALLLGTTAVPSAAATPTTLYVAGNGEPCLGGGDGTIAQPFCSVQQAADVVQPGQTVIVGVNEVHPRFEGDIHLTHSGTPTQPITFEAYGPWNGTDPNVTIEPLVFNTTDTNGFWLDGVHDVTITGFAINDDTLGGITVANSSDVTINHDRVAESGVSDAIDVTGTSHDITISRNYTTSDRDAVNIGPGVARVDVARNYLANGLGDLISVNGATGTTITSNTGGQSTCRQDSLIRVFGKASATTIENNVMELTCQVPSPAVVVAADSAGTTSSDYNNILDNGNAPTYVWAGTGYATAVDLASHTGQGTHDLNTNLMVSLKDVWPDPLENSPAIDSADANAPGFLATDFNGFAAEDDPLVANTGTGSGIVDRGAFERTDPMTVQGVLSAFQAPTGATVTETLSSTQGWAPITGYLVDFGDGSQPVPGAGPTIQHVYTTTGFHLVTATVTDSLGNVSAPTPGDDLTVVPPAPLVPRIAVRRLSGFEMVADATASSDSWNLVSATCDLGDGTGPQPLYPAMSCLHTYTHGGLYRITISLTDAGGNTASTSALIDVPTNGFSSVPLHRFINSGAGCALCRSTEPDATPGIPVMTNNVFAPGLPVARNTVAAPAGRVGVPHGVVALRNGCDSRGPCSAVAV